VNRQLNCFVLAAAHSTQVAAYQCLFPTSMFMPVPDVPCLSAVGPLFVTAMFQAESIWGIFIDFARNRAHPAVTMSRSASDLEVAQRFTCSPTNPLLPLADTFRSTLAAPLDWAPEEAVLDCALSATPEGCKPLGKGFPRTLSVGQQAQLHTMYRERRLGDPQQDVALARLRRLWESYLEDLSQKPMSDRRGFTVRSSDQSVAFTSANQLVTHLLCFPKWVVEEYSEVASDADVGATRRMRVQIVSYKEVMIGSVRLKLGGWFLASPSFLLPSEASALWFGHVEHIFEHIGPSELPNLVLQVSLSDKGSLQKGGGQA
jgi:hypothetical protein